MSHTHYRNQFREYKLGVQCENAKYKKKSVLNRKIGDILTLKNITVVNSNLEHKRTLFKMSNTRYMTSLIQRIHKTYPSKNKSCFSLKCYGNILYIFTLVICYFKESFASKNVRFVKKAKNNHVVMFKTQYIFYRYQILFLNVCKTRSWLNRQYAQQIAQWCFVYPYVLSSNSNDVDFHLFRSW